MLVRPFQAADTPDVYDICVRTADGGGDARGQYSTDDLMPDIFAGPYVWLEPEHAFVVDDGTRVVGYVVGTSDTARFVTRYRKDWLPSLGDKYAPPPPFGERMTAEDNILALHFWPERMILPELAAYPGHLHIDLLPSAQRQGLGRALIERFLSTLAAEGVPAIRVGMAAANTEARKFYDRLGFTEIPVADVEGVTFLVRPTTVLPRRAAASCS